MKRAWIWFVLNVLRPRWIVNGIGEMGLRILGVNLYYYKWPEPLVYERYPNGSTGDSDAARRWRVAHKREFGETVQTAFPGGKP